MDTKQIFSPNEEGSSKLVLEFLIIIGSSLMVYFVSGQYDFLERIVSISHAHEKWELDEIVSVAIFLMFALAIFSMRRWSEILISKKDLDQRNRLLQQALIEIKQLKGIIPICASCKNIRDDKGYWNQVELYIHEHTGAQFSHGMCPPCMEKWYPDFIKNQKDKGITYHS